MPDLPTGTVTFLFTDIEGSTHLWELHPEAMRLALDRHDALLTGCIEEHSGVVVKSRGEGDSFFAAFGRATNALAAAWALQQALLAEPWPAETPLRVRVGLHTGEADLRGGDYCGSAVNRCARLRAAAHGGQVLLSRATQELVQDDLPADISLRDLGPHRLRDLRRAEHVFQLLHPALPSSFPPLQTLDVLPNNLPQQVTSFVGREPEIAEVKRLLASTRLLTVTGAGGTGKTRLSCQVAADLLPEYEDGVWVIELAPLTDPVLAPQAAATVLGIREQPGQPLIRTLAEALKPKKLLLVLDNCEHLLAACATLADTLLRSCPGVRLLATSREGLNIAGEATYPLRALSVPDPKKLPPNLEALSQYEAVHLFIDRAVAVQPAFAVTNQNAPAVAQICHRLDGIPLALELAAARVKALPVEKINERLDDRFRLLTGGSRTALPRQQTLRALIDWSYDLLSEPERLLLRRLSVFAGGWTLEAAEAICACGAGDGSWELGVGADGSPPTPNSQLLTPNGDVLDLLTTLVEKSLVLYDEGSVVGIRDPVSGEAGPNAEPPPPNTEARYRLLETVRQYARDRLIESEEAERVRGQHLGFFLQLAEEAEPELRRHEQIEWLDRLEREQSNFRAALEWCREAGDSGQWLVDGPAESESRTDLCWSELSTNHYPPTTAVEAELRLAGALGGFWRQRGYFSEGRHCLEGALSRSSETPSSWRIPALLAAGNLALTAGDYVTGVSFYQAGLDLARAAGDPKAMATALFSLGIQAALTNDSEQATALAEEGLERAREAGDPWLAAFGLQALGVVVRMSGDLDRAATLFHDSLALARQGEDKWSIFMVLINLGGVAQARRDYEPARSAYQEALALSQELKDRLGMAWCLECLAEVAAQGQPQHGARLMGAAEELLEGIGASWPPNYVAGRERALAAIRTTLGDEAAAAAVGEGRAMTLEQAVRVALEKSAHA